MKSSQINFYLLPEDVEEIDVYLQNTNLCILPEITDEPKITLCKSLLERSNSQRKILNLKDELQNLNFKFLPAKNNYFIENSGSIGNIEFWFPKMDKQQNILHRGRLYYSKTYLENGKELSHSPSFLNQADSLFKWIRKNFRTEKMVGYESFLISPRVSQWKNTANGILALNPPIRSKKDTVKLAV